MENNFYLELEWIKDYLDIHYSLVIQERCRKQNFQIPNIEGKQNSKTNVVYQSLHSKLYTSQQIHTIITNSRNWKKLMYSHKTTALLPVVVIDVMYNMYTLHLHTRSFMEDLASYYGFSYTSKTAKAILPEALVLLRSLHLQNTQHNTLKPTKPRTSVFKCFLRSNSRIKLNSHWTSLSATNWTISREASLPLELSNLSPLSASSI